MQKFIVVISGPTGVGKSDLALQLARDVDGQIINADVGQLYTPLTIGTAKPELSNSLVAHHFFDILSAPQDFSAYDYRKRLEIMLDQLWTAHKVPFVVGGSLFYLKSLFFSQARSEEAPGSKRTDQSEIDTLILWQQLVALDPLRAQQIHPHDRYRIQRALDIWQRTGKKPSEAVPVYNPPCPYIFIFLTRTREDLYKRIMHRTHEMIDKGWIDEVRPLMGTEWEDFLHTKKIIGYNEIITYIKQGEPEGEKKALIERIVQKTKKYAKRQLIFWKMFEKKLREGIQATNDTVSTIYTLDLTLADSTLYIEQLKSIINQMRVYEQ